MGLVLVKIIIISASSIDQMDVNWILEDEMKKKPWITLIKDYLLEGTLSSGKKERRKLLRKAHRFLRKVEGSPFPYRGVPPTKKSRGYLQMYTQEPAEIILGKLWRKRSFIAGTFGQRSFGMRLIIPGNAIDAKGSQRFLKLYLQKISKWSVHDHLQFMSDIIGVLPMFKGGSKYVIVTIDYFIK